MLTPNLVDTVQGNLDTEIDSDSLLGEIGLTDQICRYSFLRRCHQHHNRIACQTLVRIVVFRKAERLSYDPVIL